MSAITTVIFDMFNTIAQDSNEHWRQTFEEIIQQQGLGVTQQVLRDAWGNGAESFRVQRTTPGAPFVSYLDGWANAFAAAFTELQLGGDPRAASQKSIDDLGTRPLFPDAPEALGILGQTHRLGVISNADDACLDPVMARIPAKFEVVISSEGGRCYKPDRRLFDSAVRQLRVDPAECVYVGDKQFEDVMGARGAGMSVVWLNRARAPLDPDLPTPDGEIYDLLELLNALERIG